MSDFDSISAWNKRKLTFVGFLFASPVPVALWTTHALPIAYETLMFWGFFLLGWAAERASADCPSCGVRIHAKYSACNGPHCIRCGEPKDTGVHAHLDLPLGKRYFCQHCGIRLVANGGDDFADRIANGKFFAVLILWIISFGFGFAGLINQMGFSYREDGTLIQDQWFSNNLICAMLIVAIAALAGLISIAKQPAETAPL